MARMPAGETTGQGPILTDGVLVLRRPVRSDADALVEAVRSSHELLWPWLRWASADYGPEHANGFLDEVEQGNERAFAIFDPSARLQGLCGLNQVDVNHRTANLGYWLRAGATGAGRATRATRLVLDHGLQELSLERIEVVMSVHNTRSRRVPERLGLTHEGIRRRALRIGDEQHDAHVFAAFREDLPRLRGA